MSIRVGLIGSQGHTNFVLQGIRETPDAELVAVAPGAPDEDIGSFMAATRSDCSPPKCYDDYGRMLDSEELDVIAVAPAFHRHAAISIEALRRGYAVYCEKPAALSRPDLARLRVAWRESGKPFGLMLNFRYDPAFYTARQMVGDGAIGEPILAYSQKTYCLGERPAFFRQRETFGGLIPWVGIHAIDWCRWVSGRRYRAVTARHGNAASPDYPGLEDQAACLFELDNGGSAVMAFDYLRPAEDVSHGDDYLRLTGTRGYLEVRFPPGLRMVLSTGPAEVPVLKPPYGPFADFLHSVMDPDHRCLVSAEDAFTVTGLALDARESADRQQRVELDEARWVRE